MALRDQPYFPLYVDDYLTDEKLNMCSASTQGVYIKILCIMHKSEPYGCILLKQKDKQKESMCLNFANKVARLLPFTFDEIRVAIDDLIDEKVLFIDGDMLCQKRMIKDNSISVLRSNAGSKGGASTQKKLKTFAKAKTKANTVIVNEYVNEDNSKNPLIKKGVVYFENQEINDVFTRWLKMLHERKKPMAASSIEALQMKLNSQSVVKSIAQITQSLEKGWLNLRPVEDSEPTISKTDAKQMDIAILKHMQSLNQKDDVQLENDYNKPSENNRLR